MGLGCVAMFLSLLLLGFCWFGFGSILILHFHEFLDLFVVEVFTEIPLPLSNLNLQTPRSLHFLSIALLSSSFLILVLVVLFGQAFLPRMSI